MSVRGKNAAMDEAIFLAGGRKVHLHPAAMNWPARAGAGPGRLRGPAVPSELPTATS